MSHNKATIEAYNQGIEAYIAKDKPLGEEEKTRVNAFLSHMTKETSLLELGTGLWKHADYIESQGYRVHRSDYADAFISYNASLWKHISKVDALAIPTDKTYQAVFANAVLLHFSGAEFEKVLQNVSAVLVHKGIFAFSIKKWVGEEVTEEDMGQPRFFKYRQEEDVKKSLSAAGFEIIDLRLRNHEKRINIIAQKI